MSRVLITGAGGFIGRHTLALLVAHGHEVHAVSREPPAGLLREIVWHRADLRDSSATGELIDRVHADLLLHLAWYVEPGKFWSSVENVRWVEGSLALTRMFMASGGGRAVLAGTCAEYDWSADGEAALSERETPLTPGTLYGSCKRATHLVTERLAAQLGAQLAWGRVFHLYGPHEQPGRLVPAIVTSLLAGAATDTTDGLQRRDFMHVEDVAAGFVALLESDVEGPVNIATGDAVEVRSLIAMIARETGREDLLRWGAIARAPSEPELIVADVERLRSEVGFTPAIGLADGVRATVDWWRRQLATGAR